MGKLALAAKITHVPSMYLSELPGKHHGCRQAAIDGHVEIGRRCRALGVRTLVVFDVHWLVNAGYHLLNAAEYSGDPNNSNQSAQSAVKRVTTVVTPWPACGQRHFPSEHD